MYGAGTGADGSELSGSDTNNKYNIIATTKTPDNFSVFMMENPKDFGFNNFQKLN